MALISEVPTNPIIYPDAGTVVAGLASDHRARVNGYIGTVEGKAQLTQAFLEQQNAYYGNGAIGGGVIAIDSGLNVTITASTAIVGNYSRNDSTGTVGLTNSAANYIYRRQDGSFEANTAGTVPGTADGKGTAMLWGSAVCSGGTVASVYNDRLFAYPNAGAWQTERLTANGTVTTRRIILAAPPGGGSITVTMPNPASVPQLPVTVKQVTAGTVGISSAGSIDGATVLALSTQYHFRTMISDGTTWHVIGS